MTTVPSPGGPSSQPGFLPGRSGTGDARAGADGGRRRRPATGAGLGRMLAMDAMDTRRSPVPGPGGMTRARALRLAGTAVLAGGALAACGTAGQGAAPQKPAQPVEIEYWSTLPETHPTGKG